MSKQLGDLFALLPMSTIVILTSFTVASAEASSSPPPCPGSYDTLEADPEQFYEALLSRCFPKTRAVILRYIEHMRKPGGAVATDYLIEAELKSATDCIDAVDRPCVIRVLDEVVRDTNAVAPRCDCKAVPDHGVLLVSRREWRSAFAWYLSEVSTFNLRLDAILGSTSRGDVVDALNVAAAGDAVKADEMFATLDNGYNPEVPYFRGVLALEAHNRRQALTFWEKGIAHYDRTGAQGSPNVYWQVVIAWALLHFNMI